MFSRLLFFLWVFVSLKKFWNLNLFVYLPVSPFDMDYKSRISILTTMNFKTIFLVLFVMLAQSALESKLRRDRIPETKSVVGRINAGSGDAQVISDLNACQAAKTKCKAGDKIPVTLLIILKVICVHKKFQNRQISFSFCKDLQVLYQYLLRIK